jgi:hypothetical protein
MKHQDGCLQFIWNNLLLASSFGVEYSLANFPLFAYRRKTPIFGGFSITSNQFLTKSPVQHVPAAGIVFHQPYSGEATPMLLHNVKQHHINVT